jgi:hypothetical protein
MDWWIFPSAFLIACFLSALLWDVRGAIVCFGLWAMVGVMAITGGAISSASNGQSFPDTLLNGLQGFGLLVALSLPLLAASFITAAVGIAIRRKWRQAQKIGTMNAQRP